MVETDIGMFRCGMQFPFLGLYRCRVRRWCHTAAAGLLKLHGNSDAVDLLQLRGATVRSESFCEERVAPGVCSG
ncbi:Hypothetical protein, putative [Bodo saltans]|uniref:Uncharacterized protein n=1 Tax=Bodo saltans TaxID=75058 RepID=A0A0S4JTV4_BODSA|nr:Hypothetical protein, putative [Bodo saltans]|eukprot:CUG93669.1 Hypothetical protein, putative [Bodo saltans]